MTATKTVKERPILFSGEMVRAILDGRKTQTRRVVKVPKWIEKLGGDLDRAFPDKAFGVTPCLQVPCSVDGSVQRLRNPWMWPSPIRLWVRETWNHYDIWTPGPEGYGKAIYRATDEPGKQGGWRPSIFMPRWASRITLKITNVRVERLNEISDADALAEGMSPMEGNCGFFWKDGEPQEIPCCECCDTPKLRFAELWDTINGKKHPWSSNRWVWVIEFKKI